MSRSSRFLACRYYEAFTFSLYNSSTSSFFSLLISPLPFFRRLFCKTLSFFSSFMESSSSYWDDDFSAFDAPPHSLFPIPPSPSPEPLFLVPFRWWSEANTSVYEGREIGGVLYNTTSCLRNKKFGKDDLESDVESEIMLEMRTAGQTDTAEEVGVSGSDVTTDLCLALISEWMFLRAFKWITRIELSNELVIYFVSSLVGYKFGTSQDRQANF